MGDDPKTRPRSRVLRFAVSGVLLIGPATMACDEEPTAVPNEPFEEVHVNEPPDPVETPTVNNPPIAEEPQVDGTEGVAPEQEESVGVDTSANRPHPNAVGFR